MKPRQQKHPRAQVDGFTIIEVLVTITVLTILIITAAPSFQQMLLRSRLNTAATGLMTAMAEARSQAISQGRRITLCKSSNGSSCATTGDWSQGWITFVDSDRSDSGGAATVDTGETILRTYPAQGQLSIAGDTGLDQFVSYAADGMAKSMSGDIQTGKIRFCSTSASLDDSARARDLTLSGSGHVNLSTPDAISSSCS